MSATAPLPATTAGEKTLTPPARSRTPWLTDNTLKYLLILPALLAVLASAIFPILRGLTNAFYYVSARPHPRNGTFVGLENFEFILTDPGFVESVRVTVMFTTISTVVTIAIALGMALLLAPGGRLRVGVRALLILPFAMSPMLVGYTWRFLFNDGFGLFAEALDVVPGLLDANWLNDRVLTLGVLIASDVWNWAPFLALILIGGLAAAPQEAQEAARVDGANGYQVFRDVTLPAILPVLLICTVLKVIFALKMFDQIYTLTQGAPGTQTLGYYIYYTAQKYSDASGAAAMSLILILPMAMLAYLYMRLVFRRAT